MSAVIKNPGQLRLMCYKVEIVMSIEAWYFLYGTTNGASNLFYFLSLLSKMQTADVQLGKREQNYTVKAGQADGSLLELSQEWRIGRKAVRRLLDDFAERGIIAVESNPLTSLISLVCVRSWVIEGRLIENPMFRSSVGKFEGVRIHLLNGQPFETLRRSSQRVGSKTGSKGGAASNTGIDSGTEPAIPPMPTDTAVGNHTICKFDDTPILRPKDMPPDDSVVGTTPPSNGTIQPHAKGTTSGVADTDLL